MNHPSEEMLALYAGADLLDDEVASHVHECADCLQIVADFRRVLEFCGGLDETAPGPRNRRFSRWNWALAAAASLAVFSMLLWPPEQKIAAPSARMPIVVPAEPVLTAAGGRPKLKRRFHAPKPRYTLVSNEELRIDTADPNVIVLVQLKGETQNP